MDATVTSMTEGKSIPRSRLEAGNAARRWRWALVLVALSWPLLGAADLTGTWYGDDGGTYYLRQLGARLFWYGERSDTNPPWSNVLIGTLGGQTIEGHWVDVPKGRTGGKGEMQLRVGAGDNTLDAARKTGGFGGSHWTRAGRMEGATNRAGSDYRSFDLVSADPALCEKTCAQETKCGAWTYVKPGVQGPKARCWLKNAVPAAKRDACCVSGVK
jgi:hypothetical protein